jgi:hypothetical protein
LNERVGGDECISPRSSERRRMPSEHLH